MSKKNKKTWKYFPWKESPKACSLKNLQNAASEDILKVGLWSKLQLFLEVLTRVGLTWLPLRIIGLVGAEALGDLALWQREMARLQLDTCYSQLFGTIGYEILGPRVAQEQCCPFAKPLSKPAISLSLNLPQNCESGCSNAPRIKWNWIICTCGTTCSSSFVYIQFERKK